MIEIFFLSLFFPQSGFIFSDSFFYLASLCSRLWFHPLVPLVTGFNFMVLFFGSSFLTFFWVTILSTILGYNFGLKIFRRGLLWYGLFNRVLISRTSPYCIGFEYVLCRPGDGAVRLNHPSKYFLVSIFYITDPTTRRAKRYAILHANS